MPAVSPSTDAWWTSRSLRCPRERSSGWTEPSVAREVETRVLAFHKPADLLTSTVSQHRTGTVYEVLLPQLSDELSRYTWHAIGRLDRGTTGLLLFTNDEKLVAHATSPETHLPKRYVATVQGTADEEKVEPLRRGVMLEDGPTRPAKVKLRDAHTVEVTVTEGRHHQVKRMLGAVGLPARALHREAVGSVELDVAEGTFRELPPEGDLPGPALRPSSFKARGSSHRFRPTRREAGREKAGRAWLTTTTWW